MTNRPRHYMLDGTKCVPATLDDFVALMEAGDRARRVADTTVGEVRISTVFLGLDHAWSGPPLLFETMLFGGTSQNECWRWGTWEAAKQGHDRVVALLESGMTPEAVSDAFVVETA